LEPTRSLKTSSNPRTNATADSKHERGRQQPDIVVATLAYLLSEAQYGLSRVAYFPFLRRWKRAKRPALYFNYAYALGWAILLALLLALSALIPSWGVLFALIGSFRFLEIGAWYLKLLFDSTHWLILSAERNLLFLAIDAAASVAIVLLWLLAATKGEGAPAEWSAALATFTLNGAPAADSGWEAAVATAVGTFAGLLLLVVGLALLVERERTLQVRHG